MTDKNRASMGNYMALETAISNGEEALVKKLLANQAMLDIEKSYLLDLANLNGHGAIIKLIKDIPLRK